MNALIDVAAYLLGTLGSLYLMVVILRFLLQVARADFYNPISQFIVKATNPFVLPLRKVIPGFAGLDMASLVLALLVQVLLMYIFTLLIFQGVPQFVSALLWSLIGLASAITKLYLFTIIVSIIFSWVAPGSSHPALLLLHQVNEPVLAPFRRLLPPMGGLDLSPILVFLLINVINILLQHASASTGLPMQLKQAMLFL